jgi:hypothetical protein
MLANPYAQRVPGIEKQNRGRCLLFCAARTRELTRVWYAPASSRLRTSAQYIFFGGIDRRICLRNLATAAAFFRLRSAVGFS